jgi:hypothetical protein
MNTGTIAMMFCAASLMIGCGGSASDSTGSAVDNLRGQANARADAGGGGGNGGGGGAGSGAGNGGQGAGGVHPCKPVGQGPSPCAHDDGGDFDDASDMDKDASDIDKDANGVDKDAGDNTGKGHAKDDGGGRPADAGKK